MSKRIRQELNKFNGENKQIKFSLGTIIVMFFCSILIVVATFIQIDLATLLSKFFALLHLQNHPFALHSYFYVPQVPILVLVAVLLGKKYGVYSVLLYIISGFFLPVYAIGGGVKYILQYNFGYILAYLPTLYVMGLILEKKYNLKNIFKAAFFGTLIVHFVGIFYMLLIAMYKHDSINQLFNFVFVQSGIKILYDFIFCIIIAILAKPIKQLFWAAIGWNER